MPIRRARLESDERLGAEGAPSAPRGAARRGVVAPQLEVPAEAVDVHVGAEAAHADGGRGDESASEARPVLVPIRTAVGRGVVPEGAVGSAADNVDARAVGGGGGGGAAREDAHPD